MVLFLNFIFLSLAAFGSEQPTPLDPPYQNLVHPAPFIETESNRRSFSIRSDVSHVIAKQTAVKSQISRGTCSIFSAIALLEALLVSEGLSPKDVDLSEEWLQYLIARNQGSYGSYSTLNFKTLIDYAAPEETYMPYIGDDWTQNPSNSLAEKRCGHLSGFSRKACLVGHRDPQLLVASEEELTDANSKLYDPDFLKARKNSQKIRDHHISDTRTTYSGVYREAEIKKLLNEGVVLTMDTDFYYGAWNHRKSEELGIPRNMDHWYKGIVGYPVPGSVDATNSRREPAGHSILIVGYDDQKEVKIPTKMQSGKTEIKTYKGVYYFKNSWGTTGFGSQFEINGVSYPGYGMITQDYAHEYGSFYTMSLE